MKALVLLVLLVACCSLPVLCSAGTLLPAAVSGSTALASGQGSGGFDEFAGQGDLITRAVPVCCCSSSTACDSDPPPPAGTPCKIGTPVCKCSGFTACVNMG